MVPVASAKERISASGGLLVGVVFATAGISLIAYSLWLRRTGNNDWAGQSWVINFVGGAAFAIAGLLSTISSLLRFLGLPGL